MKKLLILCLCLSFVSAIKTSAIDTSVEAFLNGYCFNHLIEDSEFLDRNTMTTESIQKYLEVHGSYLQSFSQNGKSAALIIYEAAYGISPDSQGTLYDITIDETTGTISPLTILVTLQKEQSLIANPNPSQGALDWAMGYGVSNPSYQGFTTQVGWGAWQLRYNFERAIKSWATYYIVGQIMMMSDATGNYDVTFTNQATAALYRYTPHVFDGNYNFWKIYHDWFYKVSDAKLKSDSSSIQLISKPVTYSEINVFYIEDGDRSCGLRIDKTNHGLISGMKADIYGNIYTNPNGERYIAAHTVIHNGNESIRTIMMPIRALGGGDWNTDSSGKGQKGIDGGIGLNNIGIKVTVCGKVSNVNQTLRTFSITDGSGTIKVVMPQGANLPNSNSITAVCGIVSCEISQNLRQCLLLGFDWKTF